MIKGTVNSKTQTLHGSVSSPQTLTGQMQRTSGVSSYEALSDKPQINGIELVGNKTLEELNIQAADQHATKTSTGVIMIGDNLSIDGQGKVSVETTNDAEQDNTKPITSAGVYTQLGNINVLLQKI